MRCDFSSAPAGGGAGGTGGALGSALGQFSWNLGYAIGARIREMGTEAERQQALDAERQRQERIFQEQARRLQEQQRQQELARQEEVDRQQDARRKEEEQRRRNEMYQHVATALGMSQLRDDKGNSDRGNGNIDVGNLGLIGVDFDQTRNPAPAVGAGGAVKTPNSLGLLSTDGDPNVVDLRNATSDTVNPRAARGDSAPSASRTKAPAVTDTLRQPRSRLINPLRNPEVYKDFLLAERERYPQYREKIDKLIADTDKLIAERTSERVFRELLRRAVLENDADERAFRGLLRRATLENDADERAFRELFRRAFLESK